MSRKPSHTTVQKNRQRYAIIFDDCCCSFIPVHVSEIPYEKDAVALFPDFVTALEYATFLNTKE